MMNWKKEKPLIGTEGLTKDLYSIFSTDYWVIQAISEGMGDSLSDGGLNG